MAVLRYGNNSSIEIETAEDSGATAPENLAPATCKLPPGDAFEATVAALADPLDYPPLAKCTTPADRIVLALDPAVPQSAEIVAAVVRTLAGSGVDTEGISVLLPPPSGGSELDDPCRLLDEDLRGVVRSHVHDPKDRRQLAYLAADEEGEAVLINRLMHEADVVLPIGCMSAERAAGYFGINGIVYPTFSDEKAIARFRGLGTLEADGSRQRELAAWAENVAWLLGVNMTVQAVPGEEGRLAHVLAGECKAVSARGREIYDKIWSREVSRQTDLVVAAIDGPASVQTWENLGRALDTASRFTDDGGAIAVCCSISARPGQGVRHLAGGATRAEALRHISRHRSPDALAAAQIAAALDRNKVYLLSQIEPTAVEELDIVPLESPEELSRLIAQHSSCTLLQDAHYVVPVG